MSAPSLHQQLELFAAQALTRYPLKADARARLHTLSENATFQVHSGSHAYALRIHRSGYHDKATILSELAWITALRESGLAVPEILPGRNGEALQTLDIPGLGTRHAVMFGWINGSEPQADDGLKPMLERLGSLTARLHLHARHWQRPAGFTRPRWNHANMVGPQGLWGDWRAAPYLDATACALIDDTVAALAEHIQDYGEGPDHVGLIHADLRFTNLLTTPQQTRIIDFDDCGLGWFMHDLAATVSFHECDPALPCWLDAWLHGYTAIASPSTGDLAIVPTLIMQRRLQLLAWSASHVGSPQADSLGPDWTADTLRMCRRYLAGHPIGMLQ